MPTRAGWLVLVGALATIAAGRILGLAELYLLGAVGLLLVIVAVVSVNRPLPALHVERRLVPRRVHVGTASRVELRVLNRGTRRTPVLVLFEPVQGTIGAQVSVAPLAPGDDHAASYRLPTERRGLVAIGPLEARRVDPFGLARRRTVVTERTHLTVLPAVELLSGLLDVGGLDDPMAGAARPVLGSPGAGDFASLRPYVAGDDLRRVHWASSARIGDLLVRQDEPPWQGHLTVMLDARTARTDATRFEFAVSAAASLVHAVSRQGDRVRLVVTDGTDTGLLDARASRDTLLEHLSVVARHDDPDLPDPPLDGRRHTGALAVITGRATAEDVQQLRRLRNRFAAMVLLVTDPGDGVPASTPEVEVVAVPDGVPFPTAWAALIGGRRR